jgi:hypothetical protein
MNIDSTIAEKNVSIATEYYKLMYSNGLQETITNPDKRTYTGGSTGFIPFKISFTLDGISGFKVYQKLRVNTSFLPFNYAKTLDFIITGLNHKLSNNDWETNVECVVIPKFEDYDKIITTGNFTYVKPPSITSPISPSMTMTGPCGSGVPQDDWIWPYRAWGWGAGGASELWNLYYKTGKIQNFRLVTNGYGWQNWPGHYVKPGDNFPSKGGVVSCNGYDAVSWYNTFPDKTKHYELAVAYTEMTAEHAKKKLKVGLDFLNSNQTNGSGVPFSEIKVALQKAGSKYPDVPFELLALMTTSEQSLNTATPSGATCQGPFSMCIWNGKEPWANIRNDWGKPFTPSSGAYKGQSCYEYFIPNKRSDGSNAFFDWVAGLIQSNFDSLKTAVK